MIDKNVFLTRKKRSLHNLEMALEQHKVDEISLPLVNLVNRIPDMYTTSSCSGRAIIIGKDKIRSKYHTKFYFKAHTMSELNLINLGDINFEPNLTGWFLFEAPNFHIGVKNLKTAEILRDIALSSGLGKSKFQSIQPSLTVEILGTGNLALPIYFENEIQVSISFFQMVIKESIELLKIEHQRLRNFQAKILSMFFDT